MKKKNIHLFLRKSVKNEHFSIENFYIELFQNFKSRKYNIKFVKCPLESKGFFKRLYLIFWSYFNQGDINHILGDINFISLFLDKEKTINTILDLFTLKRLTGFKRFIYSLFWVKIPINKSKKIITISNKVKKEITEFKKIDNKKIKVIDVSISKKFKFFKKKKIKKVPQVLIIGTSLNKNISNSLNSLQNVICKLVIVGNLNQKHINLLKNLEIQYKNYAGVSNSGIIKIYKDSDILLFASSYEGFGIPILEAQKIGIPVVTSRIDPMKYVAGKGAEFVNPNKIKSIESGLKRILTNKKYHKKLIMNGFKNQKRFSKKKILKSYIKCYDELLSQ